MTAEDAISTEGKHGAGVYGAPAKSHKTRCPQSNNPFGHHPECACRQAARPSQVVPYTEPDPWDQADDWHEEQRMEAMFGE